MKLGKKEVEQVMSTSKAKSINSSRMSSRAASRKSSRKGSFDEMEDEENPINKEEAKKVDLPRSEGGKVINKLGKGEERDSNQMEQDPDPFAAE